MQVGVCVPPPPASPPPDSPGPSCRGVSPPLSPRPRRFCEVEFQGPLSIQEQWLRHLQRHILDMNFSKADPLRGEAPPAPEPPPLAEAQ